jgi:hypothetical protein
MKKILMSDNRHTPYARDTIYVKCIRNVFMTDIEEGKISNTIMWLFGENIVEKKVRVLVETFFFFAR